MVRISREYVAGMGKMLACLLFLLAVPVLAGPWVDASVFNADVPQLQRLFPQMQKLTKPRWGPSGLRGLWVLPAVTIAGYPFEPVLFLRDGRLQRIEQSWVSDAYPCLARAVFDDLVQSINARLGNPTATGGDVQPGPATDAPVKTAFWVADDTDLIAYIEETNMRCSVRLVNRPRQLRNADEL